MVATKRIAAFFGAVTLASTLAACGGGSQEVNADDTEDQSQASDQGGAEEDAEESQQQDEPFDGSTVTFSMLTEDNIDGLCTSILGEVDEVLSSLDVDTADIDMDAYGEWTESYEEQVGSTAATFSCHATASEQAEDAESVHINVAAGQGDPSGVNEVSERSEDMSAGMTLQTSDLPEDEVLAQFLKDDVLPKFQP
ncbi:hypothetical protein ACT3SP_01010 [Brachybacterium sp. AOP43-C2-M15]|uniref:hypothetical protein n=1 Tax=Brachybacterium sp. AOP43-C2-M15 TaxID=3457661 RepID=UPI004033F052